MVDIVGYRSVCNDGRTQNKECILNCKFTKSIYNFSLDLPDTLHMSRSSPAVSDGARPRAFGDACCLPAPITGTVTVTGRWNLRRNGSMETTGLAATRRPPATDDSTSGPTGATYERKASFSKHYKCNSLSTNVKLIRSFELSCMWTVREIRVQDNRFVNLLRRTVIVSSEQQMKKQHLQSDIRRFPAGFLWKRDLDSLR